MKLQVIKSFKDKVTKALCEVGAEIELTDVDRINDVVVRGLCRIVSVEGPANDPSPVGKISLFEQEFDRGVVNAALKLAGIKGNIAAFGDDTVVAKVAGLDEANLNIFKEALLAE